MYKFKETPFGYPFMYKDHVQILRKHPSGIPLCTRIMYKSKERFNSI